jgi:hypothetical protein
MLAVVVAIAAMSGAARGQSAAGEDAPASRWAFGAELSVSFGSSDRGYFTFADYESSTLRLFAAGLAASLQLAPGVSLVGEARTENGDGVRASALFVRWRPWRDRTFDVQAGRIPPIFGRYARRGYGSDNPLIGWPIAYQYLTTLRPDAVPRTADTLLAIRGRGWRVVYDSTTPARAGVPVSSVFRWDTGLQVRAGRGTLEGAIAVTQGTLSNPRVDDDNGRKQVVGRLTWAPRPSLSLGASGAWGRFLADAAMRDVAGGREGDQQALGADAEVSSGYWIVRAEIISSWWRLPALASPPIESALRATAASLEMRYRLRPGLYVAARGERLGFSSLEGTLFGGRATSWDAPVGRVEAGLGYSLGRRVLLKASWQYNERDSARPRRVGRLAAVQVSTWF